MVTTAPAIRPALQARSVASRRRMLDATIASLIELGYARTTTTEVVKRAGMSQGALFKHFPNKALLMGAAAEHLFGQLIVSYRAAFASLAQERIVELTARLDAAIDLLWDVFMGAPMQAANELYVAARSDDDLADVLRPIMERHAANLLQEATQLFPEITDSSALSTLIAGLMASMQGASLMVPISGVTDSSAAELAFIRRAVMHECAYVFANDTTNRT
jgi:AcrR family transcriptional regulator